MEIIWVLIVLAIVVGTLWAIFFAERIEPPYEGKKPTRISDLELAMYVDQAKEDLRKNTKPIDGKSVPVRRKKKK